MSKPEISVLMSVYNHQDTIKSAIESILNQTYDNFKFFISDDCSTDNSYEVLKELSKIDNRIKIFKNEKNIGLTRSLNYLINQSESIFIARQDSDDFSFSTRFEKQINFINENNLDGCSTRAIIRNSQKVIPNLSFYINEKIILRYKNPFIHGTLFLKRSAMQAVGNYDERFVYAQDYKLMTDLLKKGFKFKIFKDALYELNMENNISKNFTNEQNYFANCVKNDLDPL